MSREKVLEQFMGPERIARFEGVLAQRTNTLTVVLDGVHNDHNISAVIRSADAFGLTKIHLVGDKFSYRPGVTLGTERWLDIEPHESGAAALERLRADGFTIAVTAPAEDPRRPKDSRVQVLPVYQLPFEKKLAVVFGNERTGVSKELMDAAEIHAYIPMIGFVESLNISVACAITLYSSLLGRVEAERKVPKLSEDERESLRAEWLVTGMRRADLILREFERREQEALKA